MSVETFVSLGLTPSEARLYLAVVHAPGARVTDLAEEADVPRSRACRLLARLEERGLVRPRPGVSRRYEAVLSPSAAVRQLAAERYVNLTARTQRALDAVGVPTPLEAAQGEAEGALGDALSKAKESVLAILQDTPLAEDLAEALHRAPPSVRVRVITEHAAPAILARPRVEIRVRPNLAASYVVVDGKAAFFHSSLLLGPGPEPPLVSRSRTFAAALTDAFEASWERAEPIRSNDL